MPRCVQYRKCPLPVTVNSPGVYQLSSNQRCNLETTLHCCHMRPVSSLSSWPCQVSGDLAMRGCGGRPLCGVHDQGEPGAHTAGGGRHSVECSAYVSRVPHDGSTVSTQCYISRGRRIQRSLPRFSLSRGGCPLSSFVLTKSGPSSGIIAQNRACSYLQDVGREDLDENEESAHWRRRYTLRHGLSRGSYDVPSFLEPVKRMVLETGETSCGQMRYCQNTVCYL